MRISFVRRAAITVASLALLSPVAGYAAERTVTLGVENATCALCVPIVRTVLQRVPGVTSVDVVENYSISPPVSATVVFDDDVTNVDALINATTNAGYPSRLALNTGD
ncbi:cation transporter [Chelativorans xinjiangense]|uniref:cation transporter n=1 Tax=Chelativorans xinjiangense TaxID=2681485 RepID=UPI0013597C9A|nr:cation transporter [Chelativorans xinjiangense]